MRRTTPMPDHRARRRRTVATAALACGVALAACGSGSTESGGGARTTTTRAAEDSDAICRAAVAAAAAASDDLSDLANSHIDAFNTAIDAADAWDTGDQAAFAAKAAEFRAFAANEENQASRIETDKRTVSGTTRACRDALGGDPMSPSCEEAIALLADHRTHSYEVIAAGDALYAAAERLLAGAEAQNVSMVDAASSQINVAMSTLDAALADDAAKFDAADAATTRCEESGSGSSERESSRSSVGVPTDQEVEGVRDAR